jgi:hypothetical protein
MKGVTIVQGNQRDETLVYWRTVLHPARLSVSSQLRTVINLLLDEFVTTADLPDEGDWTITDARDTLRAAAAVVGATRVQEAWLLERFERLLQGVAHADPSVDATLAEIVDGKLYDLPEGIRERARFLLAAIAKGEPFPRLGGRVLSGSKDWVTFKLGPSYRLLAEKRGGKLRPHILCTHERYNHVAPTLVRD